MKKILIAAYLLSLVLLVPQIATASGGERITNLQSTANLSLENVLSVSESITVDYGANSHHGIYRRIPIVLTNGSDKYYFKFTLLGVTSSTGAPTNIVPQNNTDPFKSNEIIQIGDPSRAVSGVQEYNIRYLLSPIAMRNGEVDRVNINVAGQNWEYPIDRASMDLTVPAVPLATPICYTGLTGSAAHDCIVTQNGATVRVASNLTLNSGEGLTLDMNLPKGSFSSYLAPSLLPPLNAELLMRIILVAASWIAGLIAILLAIRRSLQARALRRNQTVVAQYEPPDNLAPAQIGMLIDSKGDMTEFTSTIIDLAVRGFLKISQIEIVHFGPIDMKDYQFDKLKPAENLRDFEQTVFNFLFQTSDSVKLSMLSAMGSGGSNKIIVDQYQKQVAASLKTVGYFRQNADLVNRSAWTLAPFGMLWTPLLILGGMATIVPYLIGISCIIYAFMKLAKYPKLTPEGVAEWAKIDGFKLYLSVAEKDRLNFSDAPEKTPERFNKLLPYAVALGVEKQWAKQFDGIDVTPTNGWYASAGIMAFSSADFASSFASSFGSSMNSGFSGSSGSGGAGTGGGGGGGGGW